MVSLGVARNSAIAPSSALTKSGPPPWVRALRQQIRSLAGPGWSITEQSGYTKVCLRYRDSSRTTAMLHLPWRPGSVPDLLSAIVLIEQKVRGGASLAAAVQGLALPKPGAPTRDTVAWEDLGEAWCAWLVSTGACSRRTYLRSHSRTVRLLAAANPSGPREALEAVAQGPPGSRGRQVKVQACARFLRWCVEAGKLPDRWAPPSRVSQWVGKAPSRPPANTPRSDAEILALLEQAEGDRYWGLLAVLATFGLRPHECLYFVWDDDGPRILQGKTGPRRLVPCPPAGLDVAAVRRARLPRPPKTQERASSTYSLALGRRSWWRESGMRLYMLRHSYAERLHLRGVTPKDAARLMGHSLAQQIASYSRFGGEADTLARVVAVLGRNS